MSKRQIQIIDSGNRPIGESDNPFAVGGVPQHVYISDRSTTLMLTDKLIMESNPQRLFLILQNPNRYPIWIEFGQAAVAGFPSVRLDPGATMMCEDPSVPADDIHAIGLVDGLKLVAKEGLPDKSE